MTAVQTLGPANEPGDLQALAGRRAPRAGARGGPRFQLSAAGPAEDIKASGQDRASQPVRRRPGGADAGATPDGAVLPGVDPAPLPGSGTTALSPDLAVAANLPAEVGPASAAAEPALSVEAAEAQGISRASAGRAAGAGRDRGAGPEPDARPEATGDMPAQAERADGAPAERPDAAGPAGGGAAPAAPAARGAHTAAGPSIAEAAGTQAAAPARQTGAAPARAGSKPEKSAPASAPAMGFRMEPAEVRAGAAARPAAGPPEPRPDAPMPADIVVAQGAERLDVTIAAATPDLRDRFQAATDELQADLAAIGTEVDAIHVELRGDSTDGQPGAGQMFGGDGNRADMPWADAERGGADFARSEAGGVGDAMARPEDGSADAAAGLSEEAQADDGLEARADAEAGGARDGAGRDRAARDGERLRVLLTQLRPAPDPSAAATEVGPARTGQGQRIDRYA